jgi:DNA-binding PadR family transcriptional regulator
MPPKTSLGEFEQLVLLAILRSSPDAHGVRLVTELDAAAGRAVSRGALYTTLDRLETKGLLRWKVAAGSGERGGLPRRIYTVTPRGIAALRTSRQVLSRLWKGLERILEDPGR